MRGVYRPTEDSMMNTNTCGFNASSRKAIYDMVMRRGENRETSYEEFADFDSRNVSQVQTLTRTSNAISRPFTHPHFVHKSINNKAPKAKKEINELPESIYVSAG